MNLLLLELIWCFIVIINGQTEDPLCDSCYKLELREIKDVSNAFYIGYLFKYDLITCDFPSIYGKIIIGSANAKNRCGAKLRQIISGVSGMGTVKHTIRTGGPLKFRGVEIGQNSNNNVQIFVEGRINTTAKIGYVSYSSTSLMRDIVSCPVTRTLPDYCADSNNNNVFVYVGDDEIGIDDWEILMDQAAEMEIEEEEQKEESVLINNNDLIVSEENDNHYQGSFYSMIAVIVMIPMMYIFMKWMKPKLEHKDYTEIPCDV